MKNILNKIDQYSQILLYRHVNPDYDAFGSQFAFYAYLSEKYDDKNIVMMGDFSSDLVELYTNHYNQEIRDEKSLAIVCDTANRERIDGDISLADEIIKIDHHIIVDQYGNINYVDEKASSCAQIIALMFRDADIHLNELAARSLYIGIIGDSNRFLYRNTDSRTFNAASYLVSTPIDIEKIYQDMYLTDEKQLKVTQFILNHYQVFNQVAYYILMDEDLHDLGISREQGSNYVNTLANIKQFEVWIALTENKVEDTIRVSIRSRSVPINQIAQKYSGGGHALASGATLQNTTQIDSLLLDLQEAINEYKKGKK